MSESTKVGILGAGKPGKVGILGVGKPGSVNAVLTVAEEVKRVELLNRRKLLEELTVTHNEQKLFKQYMNLSAKELKKYSKSFIFIHRYLDGLGLERYYGSQASPSTEQARRIAIMLNSMISSKVFSALDLEKSKTDYFQLLVGLYICMKDVVANFSKARPNHKGVGQLTYVASELGLRLYSMYIDERLDNAQSDYEKVSLR